MIGFSTPPEPFSFQDLLPKRLTVLDLLRSVRLRPAGSGGAREFYKMWCPFHERASGRTLWVANSSGTWGCHSDRCPQRSGGPLWRLLALRGMSDVEAKRLELQVDFTHVERARNVGLQGLEQTTLVREPHVQAWKVDWKLATDVYSAAQEYHHLYVPGAPLSDWLPECPADPGTLEHDFWEQLWYMHGHRALSPDALDTMDVGFDRRIQQLVFPVRSSTGEVRGVARRIAADGKPYVLGGSIYVPEDGTEAQGGPYQYAHVERADVLWGWSELLDRIEAGETVVVVEGYADQLRLLSYGFCAVAKLGRILTDAQVKLLLTAPGRKVIWPDFDVPGLRDAPKDAAKAPGSFHFVVDGGGFKDAGHVGVTYDVVVRALATAVTAPMFVVRVADLMASVKK